MGVILFDMNFVSSNYGSNMDFYLRYNNFWGVSGVLAETRFYSNTGSNIQPYTSNWSFANIYINHDGISCLVFRMIWP